MQIAQTQTDEALVEEIRQGNGSAFDVLYERYSQRLFAYIFRYVQDQQQAEDLFQDVLMTVLRDRSFSPSRGKFAPWLFTVARNSCRTLRRDEQRQAAKQGLIPADETDETLQDSIERRDQAVALQTAMSALPRPQQEVLLLRQVADLSYREIADIEGVPEGTVKSRLHLAIRDLRRRMATAMGETR